MLLWKLHTTCRRQTDFDPATLFGVGDQGFYLNASVLTSMIEAGTGNNAQQYFDARDPRTQSGMTCARVVDLSPHGYEFVPQGGDPTDGPSLFKTIEHNQLKYHWWFHSKGLQLNSAIPIPVDKYDVICAIDNFSGQSGYRGILTTRNTSLFAHGATHAPGTWNGAGWQPAVMDSEQADRYRRGTPMVISMAGGSTGSFRVDGRQAGTFPSTTGQGTDTVVGGLDAHNQRLSAFMHAILVINRRLTENEILSTERYFSYLMNTTLLT